MPNPTAEIQAGRLVRLEAENIQNLIAIDIPLPDDGVVCIGGKNGAGKSSVLGCIAMALGGADDMPTDPIRIGEDSGKILLEFEGITIKLKLTLQDDKTVNRYLVIESKDGAKYNSPQALLNTLTGKLAFDPLEFSMKEPKEQLAMLHKFLGIDLAPLAAKRLGSYNERTVQNRFLSAAQMKLTAAVKYPDAPKTLVDAKAIHSELEAALEKNRMTEACVLKAQELASGRELSLNQIEAAKAEITRLEKDLKEIDQMIAANHAATPSAKVDTSEILGRLQSVQQTNAKVDANKKFDDLKAEVDERTAHVAAINRDIAAFDAEKTRLITTAEYPLDGMGVSDDEVTFQNVRFSQLNDATKIAVSCAMGLSLNPKLKLMIIRQGCHLDDEMLGVVRDMAKQAGALILVERVGEGKECKVIIADGNVKEIRQ